MERDISYGHLSDYSDDFEEDERIVPPPVRPAVAAARAKKGVHQPEIKARSLPPSTKHVASWKVGAKSRAFSRQLPPHRRHGNARRSSPSGPAARMLSAKQRANAGLRNELAEVRRELESVQKESRLLRRVQARTTRDLSRFQEKEGELPQVLARHAEEVRALREHLKRSHDTASDQQRRLRDMSQEMLRLNDRNRSLEEMVKRRGLKEREGLTGQLKAVQAKLAEAEKKNSSLERQMELMRRSHGQEMRALLARGRALALEVEQLRQAEHRANAHLKEKSKEVDLMNIYSQRIARNMPHGLPRPSLLNTHSQTSFSCPPFKSVSLQTRPRISHASSQTELARHRLTISTQTDQKEGVWSGVGPGEEGGAQASGGKAATRGVDSSPASIPAPAPGIFPTSTDPLLMPSPRQPGPASRGVTTSSPAHKNMAPTDASPAMLQPSPVAKPSGARPGDGVRQDGTDDQEERNKKDTLLARLRALDGHKVPPASQTVSIATAATTAPAPKSLAEATPTSTTTAAKWPPGVAPPTGPTHHPSTKSGEGVKAGEGEDEAECKKRLLLAKLLAIDTGGAAESPGHAPTSGRKAGVKKSGNAGSGPGSASSRASVSSWPDSVENMHHGRPALASQGDPFGSQHLLSGAGKSSAGKRGRRVRREESQEQPWRQQQDGASREKFEDSESKAGTGTVGGGVGGGIGKTGHPVLHGRRAKDVAKATTEGSLLGSLERERGPHSSVAASDPPIAPTAATTRDYPWEHRVDIATGNQAPSRGNKNGMLSGAGVSGPGTRPLLPLRPKAETMMPGAIPEPEDLEELAL